MASQSVQDLLKASIINLDKPGDIDSHIITVKIKRLLNIERIGHAGTLDPNVTGVLPIFIGKATRLSQYFLEDKEYEGEMHMHMPMPLKIIKQMIKLKFLGKIKQIPPARSAVKIAEREREIYKFEVKNGKKPKDKEFKNKNFEFKVHCQAGTYIRKLIHDLGQELKVGAHMQELRRTRDGILTDKTAITYDQLREAIIEYQNGNEKILAKYLLPIETITKNMPKLVVKNEFLTKIQNGCPIFINFIKNTKKKSKPVKQDQRIAIMSEDNRLIEIAISKPHDNILAVPETVFVL